MNRDKEDKAHRLIDRIQNSHWFWHNEEAKFIIKKKYRKRQIKVSMTTLTLTLSMTQKMVFHLFAQAFLVLYLIFPPTLV